MDIYVTNISPLEGPPEVDFIRAEVSFQEEIKRSKDGKDIPANKIIVDLWLPRDESVTFGQLKSAAIQRAFEILSEIVKNRPS